MRWSARSTRRGAMSAVSPRGRKSQSSALPTSTWTTLAASPAAAPAAMPPPGARPPAPFGLGCGAPPGMRTTRSRPLAISPLLLRGRLAGRPAPMARWCRGWASESAGRRRRCPWRRLGRPRDRLAPVPGGNAADDQEQPQPAAGGEVLLEEEQGEQRADHGLDARRDRRRRRVDPPYRREVAEVRAEHRAQPQARDVDPAGQRAGRDGRLADQRDRKSGV